MDGSVYMCLFLALNHGLCPHAGLFTLAKALRKQDWVFALNHICTAMVDVRIVGSGSYDFLVDTQVPVIKFTGKLLGQEVVIDITAARFSGILLECWNVVMFAMDPF